MFSPLPAMLSILTQIIQESNMCRCTLTSIHSPQSIQNTENVVRYGIVIDKIIELIASTCFKGIEDHLWCLPGEFLGSQCQLTVHHNTDRTSHFNDTYIVFSIVVDRKGISKCITINTVRCRMVECIKIQLLRSRI